MDTEPSRSILGARGNRNADDKWVTMITLFGLHAQAGRVLLPDTYQPDVPEFPVSMSRMELKQKIQSALEAVRPV